MARYDVVSINPKTKLLESMPFGTLEQAESHKRTATKEGRLLVEVIDSPERFNAWKKEAHEMLNLNERRQ